MNGIDINSRLFTSCDKRLNRKALDKCSAGLRTGSSTSKAFSYDFPPYCLFKMYCMNCDLHGLG